MMSVRRKLFVAMASFIIALGVAFSFLTLVVVRDTIHAMVHVDRSKEIAAISGQLTDYYRQKGRSWEGVDRFVPKEGWSDHADAQALLTSLNRKPLYTTGTNRHAFLISLGMRSEVQLNGETIAYLYYYDEEVGNIAKLRIGISSSVTVLLLFGCIVLILLSLLVAYRLAKRITAPLRQLIPAIDRLGKGELGVQVPVASNDEYGKVAQAFNAMSTQIQRAEDVRRSLVADVAHELRTPITIIRGKLDLVQQSGHSIEPESLLPLQDELIRLTRLVDDLHLLSLAEAKKLPFERKPTSISALLRRVVDHVAPDAENKGVALRLHGSDRKAIACVDSNRIIQVFLNLLVNAIRYTPSGGSVSVAAEEEAAQAGRGGMVRVTIADTGIGIAPEHLPLLFNRFFRTDEARARNGGGAGLGLAIARELVLAHDGTIDAESSPGHGTTFIVRLPLAADDNAYGTAHDTAHGAAHDDPL